MTAMPAAVRTTTWHLPTLRLGRFRGVLVLELSECREAVERARGARTVRRSGTADATRRVERDRDRLLGQRLAL